VGTAEQVKRQLDQMKEMTSGGPADDLAKDLARGEFGKSMQDLKKLQEKLASGKMTEREKQELARQLAEIKKQLEKVANQEERRKQLEEARKNGMISEQQYQEQKRKLDQQAKQMEALQKLAQKLGEAQQQMSAGEMKQAAASLKEAESQVGELAEQMQQIESLDAALAELQEAKNALADQGMNQLGEQLQGFNALGMDGMRPGNGQGLGRGRGRGDRPEAPDRTASYDSKVRQQITKGKAMPAGFSDPSKVVRGESLLIEQGNVEAAVGAETEALSDQKIPNSVRKHIQAYFDQVRQGE
jgi:myosin heavy subunit